MPGCKRYFIPVQRTNNIVIMNLENARSRLIPSSKGYIDADWFVGLYENAAEKDGRVIVQSEDRYIMTGEMIAPEDIVGWARLDEPEAGSRCF